LILPFHVPANRAGPPRAGAGAGRDCDFAAGSASETVDFDPERFVFGFGASVCSGAALGVGFSSGSTIGAGDGCAIIKINNETTRKRSDPLMG